MRLLLSHHKGHHKPCAISQCELYAHPSFTKRPETPISIKLHHKIFTFINIIQPSAEGEGPVLFPVFFKHLLTALQLNILSFRSDSHNSTVHVKYVFLFNT